MLCCFHPSSFWQKRHFSRLHLFIFSTLQYFMKTNYVNFCCRQSVLKTWIPLHLQFMTFSRSQFHLLFCKSLLIILPYSWPSPTPVYLFLLLKSICMIYLPPPFPVWSLHIVCSADSVMSCSSVMLFGECFHLWPPFASTLVFVEFPLTESCLSTLYVLLHSLTLALFCSSHLQC